MLVILQADKINNNLKTFRIMTYAEFTTRTNVEVENKEFDAINEVYMNCDLDKDEFCKMWCKMNASRVAKAKAEKKQVEEEMKEREALAEIVNKDFWFDNQYDKLACEVFTKKEINVIEKRIETRKTIYNELFNVYHEVPKTTSEVVYEIKKYLGWVA